ncbi:MAG: CCA tRNA nucleotidyltransferase [Planctomycetota bacterium]|nr:CCA tRNA nucleotidyltransferase [Planctomycetota bacterium]
MTNKQAAIEIINKLHRSGFQALLAGGCVRDMLLGRPANDYDVATDAEPADVIKLFKRTIKIGAKFGVVMVLAGGQQIEVATFRSEMGYTDGRHPGSVKFTSTIEDAKRRDFTINAMFYDPVQKEVIDYVNGRADLKKRIVRTVGIPKERFDEDYLRMLRAVRFSAQLGFGVEPKTWSAVCANAKNIVRISGERIAMELEGILISPNRSIGTSMLIKSGLADAIFYEFTGRQSEMAVRVLEHLRKKVDFALALAAFFVAWPTEASLEKMKVLKLSRNQIKHIKFLLTGRGKLLDKNMSLSALKLIAAEPYFHDLYELQRAIQKAEKKSVAALASLRRRIKALGDIELKPRPVLNGDELIELGAVPGPTLGQLAQEMYIAQLEGQLETKKYAHQWVRNWLEKRRTIR